MFWGRVNEEIINTGPGVYIGLSTTVNFHYASGEILTDAEGVKTATCLNDPYNRNHWQRLRSLNPVDNPERTLAGDQAKSRETPFRLVYLQKF